MDWEQGWLIGWKRSDTIPINPLDSDYDAPPVLDEMQPAKEPRFDMDVKKAEQITKKASTQPTKLLMMVGIAAAGLLTVVVGTRMVSEAVTGKKFPTLPSFLQTETPAPDSWKSIVAVKPYYLLAIRHDGKYELRTGGRSAWRYNNPGKLVHSGFSRKHKALGSDGKLALFPSYEAGRRALEVMLFESDMGFQSKTIEDAIIKFAPKTDKYDPASYAKAVAKTTGTTLTTYLTDLTEKQRSLFLDEVETQEKYIMGKTTLFKNATEFDLRGW